MRIPIIGATGFIGKHLAKHLEKMGNQVIAVSRNPEKATSLLGSGIGYDGPYSTHECDERAPSGTGFLAGLTSSWEVSVSGLSSKGIRVVYLGSGVVLGKGEGMLQRLSVPFRFGEGVIPGWGKQWLPWIHIDDLDIVAVYTNHDFEPHMVSRDAEIKRLLDSQGIRFVRASHLKINYNLTLIFTRFGNFTGFLILFYKGS